MQLPPVVGQLLDNTQVGVYKTRTKQTKGQTFLPTLS